MESTDSNKKQTSAKANKKPVQLEQMIKPKDTLPTQTSTQQSENNNNKSAMVEQMSSQSVNEQLLDKLQQLSLDPTVMTTADKQGPTQTKINELLAKLPKVAQNKESIEEQANALNDFFQNEVVALLRQIHESTVDADCATQMCNYQQEEYLQRQQKAMMLQQRYQVITQEYNQQNKDFERKHGEITVAEVSKREKISTDFESHITTITQSMSDEIETLKCTEKFTEDDPEDAEKKIDREVSYDNEVIMENAQLERKYKDLLVEITEKSEMMDKQLADKNSGVLNIEETIDLQIKQQEESLIQNIEVYQKQGEIKLNEEVELIKIKKEYQSKYQEFEKHHKTAKQLANMKTKSVNQLQDKVRQLEKVKEREELKTKKSKPKGAADMANEEAFQAFEKGQAEKLVKAVEKRDFLKNECARLQSEIENKKQQQAK